MDALTMRLALFAGLVIVVIALNMMAGRTKPRRLRDLKIRRRSMLSAGLTPQEPPEPIVAQRSGKRLWRWVQVVLTIGLGLVVLGLAIWLWARSTGRL